MIEQHLQDYVAEVERSIAENDWEAYGRLFAQDVMMRFPGAIGGASGREARVEFARASSARSPMDVSQASVPSATGSGPASSTASAERTPGPPSR
jgi:hypothetical protein